MSEKPDYSCRVFKNEDEEQVKRLVKSVFGESLDGEFWNWKYKLNPNFNPSLVMVAEKDGVIIGCDHWLLKSLKLSPSLKTKAVLGAELAVYPEYRSKGVGKALLHSLRSSEVVKNENPLIAQIFVSNASLAKHFHTPAGGYVPAPDRTAYYLKILNWKEVEANVRRFNSQIAAGKFRDRLSKFELKILFNFSNAPQLYLHMTENGIAVGEKNQDYEKTADVVIAGDLSTLQKIKIKKKRLRNVLTALITGKLKIKGKPRKLHCFYQNLWILQEIFSRKIT